MIPEDTLAKQGRCLLRLFTALLCSGFMLFAPLSPMLMGI